MAAYDVLLGAGIHPPLRASAHDDAHQIARLGSAWLAECPQLLRLGSIDAGVYRDSAYPSLAQAEKAVVSAIAIYHKPVGVESQGGAHAQYITGYKVTGDDPSTGLLDFSIVGVYLTDPWRSARYRDSWITAARWHWGWSWLQFDPYRQTDSPYRDPIDGQIGRTEWDGKWVIIEPVK